MTFIVILIVLIVLNIILGIILGFKYHKVYAEAQRLRISIKEVLLAQKDVQYVKNNLLTSTRCEQCRMIVEWILSKVIGTGSCISACTTLESAFALANLVFFEFEEILDPIKATCETTLEDICSKYGFDWVSKNIGPVAEKICQVAKIC